MVDISHLLVPIVILVVHLLLISLHLEGFLRENCLILIVGGVNFIEFLRLTRPTLHQILLSGPAPIINRLQNLLGLFEGRVGELH